jgi:hypothetical protein
MKKILLIAMLAFSSLASANTFGPLANFDVINDTGAVAHGFEIEIDGIVPGNITSLFGQPGRWPGMERYGNPIVTTTATGVRVTYKDLTKSTPSGTLPVSPSDSCWPLGAKTYGPLYPCDHFGVSTSVATPVVRYHWLIEPTPGNLNVIPVDAKVPDVQIVVTPAAPQPHAVMVAPAPNTFEFGEARWVKATATGFKKNIAVEELMGDNALIQNAVTQIEWQRLQYDSGKPPGGANGTIDMSGFALDPGSVGIAYRFEYYAYNGQYDPETHEAITGIDTSGSKTPPSTVGIYLGAQMVGVNFDGVIPPAPPLPIAPTINATISGGIVGQPYSQVVNITPIAAADTVQAIINGLPAGLTFDDATKTISGTPTVVGSFPISITANDLSNNTTISANTFLDVADAPMVFNVAFNAATIGTPYTYQFSITGGYGAVHYSTVAKLPAGLSIVNDTLTGTPTETGSFPIIMSVMDSLNFTQNAALSTLVVNAAPIVVIPPVIPVPVACAATNAVITSASPVTIEIGGGIANKGQTLDVPANITFVSPLTYVNAYAADNLVTFSGFIDNGTKHCVADTASIAQGLTVSTLVPVNGQVGVDYSVNAIKVNISGGIAPYTVAVSGLPNGLSLDASNTLVGTPTVAGTFTLAISVNDSNAVTINSSATLVITPAPVVSPLACSGSAKIVNGNLQQYYAMSLDSGAIVAYSNATTWNKTHTMLIGGTTVTTFSGIADATTMTKAGTLVTYSGVMDANPGYACLPSNIDFYQAPVVPVCLATELLTNGVCVPDPICPVNSSIVNHVCVANPLPVCSATEHLVGYTCVANPVVVPPVVIPSCTAPAGSKSVTGHAKISTVNAGSVVISGKTVNVLNCTKITYNGSYNAKYPKALTVNYDDEWSGYSLNGIIYATSMIVDNGR